MIPLSTHLSIHTHSFVRQLVLSARPSIRTSSYGCIFDVNMLNKYDGKCLSPECSKYYLHHVKISIVRSDVREEFLRLRLINLW